MLAGGFAGPGPINVDDQLAHAGLGADPRAFGLSQFGQQRIAAIAGFNRHINARNRVSVRASVMARFAVVAVTIPRVIHTINTSSRHRQNTPKTDPTRKIVRKNFRLRIDSTDYEDDPDLGGASAID